jgi:phospholipid N-methyltransferase
LSTHIKPVKLSKKHHTRAFLRQFLRNPIRTGAIVPSSIFLTESMLLDTDPAQVKCYVEYGPGSGSFTFQASQVFPLIKRMVLFEINPFFISLMQQQYPKAEVATGPTELALEVNGQADLVISGLPFTNIPFDVSTRTIDEIVEILKPGGSFRTFLYAHTFYLPKNSDLRDYIRQKFAGQVAYRFVGRNVPPAVVIEARRPL